MVARVHGGLHPRRVHKEATLSFPPWPSPTKDFVGVLGTGYPDLPTCGPGHGSTNGPVRPGFTSNSSRSSRGAKPREADDTKTFLGAASLGWLPRSRDIYARGTSRGARDVSRDDRGQAGASTRSVLVSSLVLRKQAQARSTEESSKGFHIGATRPRPAGR